MFFNSGFPLILFFFLGIFFVFGCASLQREYEIEDSIAQGKTESRIKRYRVVHDGPDHLALWINYFYDGSEGDRVFIGAITKLDGKPTWHWAYRPDPVYDGNGWAEVLISMNSSSPDEYFSDEIEIRIYVGGKGTFTEATIPYEKEWKRVIPKNTCHLKWGRGCGH